MFHKVKTDKIYMKIVKQIEQLIVKGELKPGMKLPSENELAESFGASRPTVREALCALEILGYVETRKGIGNFIKDFSDGSNKDIFREKLNNESDAYEIFETRLTFEPASMDLVVENINDNDCKMLEEYLDLMAKNILQNEWEEFDRNDLLFHITLGEATHNSLMAEAITTINIKRDDTIWKALKMKCLMDPVKINEYFDEHVRIYNAIKNGDAKKAKVEMKKHIYAMKKDLFGINDKNRYNNTKKEI